MKQEYRKDKCTMNIAMSASVFLILMTGFVVYSYFSDTHEDYNGWIVAATLLMNIGGGIYCLVAVSVKTRELYKKMLIGVIIGMVFFTLSVAGCCVMVIFITKNYDDLVGLVLCYVIFLVSSIFSARVYERVNVALLNKEAKEPTTVVSEKK
jgi:MFS family permease